jgi:hypothetical protein|tara:strand:- start:152 stop:316 length:165 start_codon:yes stop_codon:yes gene_type:complete
MSLRFLKPDQFKKQPAAQEKPVIKEKICSHCDSKQAWYSSDYGRTWQCFNHKKD